MNEESLPDLKMTLNSNRVMIGAISDESRQNWVVVTSLDNLVKGASGQAIHNIKLMYGLDDTMGLH